MIYSAHCGGVDSDENEKEQRQGARSLGIAMLAGRESEREKRLFVLLLCDRETCVMLVGSIDISISLHARTKDKHVQHIVQVLDNALRGRTCEAQRRVAIRSKAHTANFSFVILSCIRLA